jgi:hypothetical protein
MKKFFFSAAIATILIFINLPGLLAQSSEPVKKNDSFCWIPIVVFCVIMIIAIIAFYRNTFPPKKENQIDE